MQSKCLIMRTAVVRTASKARSARHFAILWKITDVQKSFIMAIRLNIQTFGGDPLSPLHDSEGPRTFFSMYKLYSGGSKTHVFHVSPYLGGWSCRTGAMNRVSRRHLPSNFIFLWEILSDTASEEKGYISVKSSTACDRRGPAGKVVTVENQGFLSI